MKNKTLLGIIFAIAGGVFWGFSGTCGEFVFKNYQVNSTWLCSVRILIAGLILLGISFIKYRDKLIALLKNKRDLLQTTLFGIFGLLMSQYCYLTAISHSNAGTATVLQYVGPVMIMVIACFADRRLPRLAELIALILAVGGTFLIATHGDPTSLSITPAALFFGLLSALALVFYTMLPVSVIPKYGTIPVIGLGMTVSGVILFFIVRPWTYDVVLDVAGIAACAALLLIGTVLAYTVYLMGVEYAGAVKASVACSVEPIAAAVFSALWIGNKFLAVDVIGFAAIISAVVILSLSKKKE